MKVDGRAGVVVFSDRIPWSEAVLGHIDKCILKAKSIKLNYNIYLCLWYYDNSRG